MSNITEATTHHTSEPVSPAAYVFAVLGTAWTIGTNAIILLSFYRDRARVQTTFNSLVCSMAASDLFVGITVVPFLVRDGSNGQLNDYGCLISFYLLFSSHAVSLLHVLGICIYRHAQIQRITKVSSSLTKKKNRKVVLGVAIFSWTTPFLLNAGPYFIYGKVKGVDIFCSFDKVFGTNFQTLALLTSIFYVTAQWITNLLYIITIYRLRFTVRTESARTVPEAAQSEQVMLDHVPQTNSIHTQMERRAIWTIGILLLLFNIFTFPTTVAGFMIGRKNLLNSNIRYIIGTFFVVNSGLNPVVNAVRIPSIREALKSFFLDVKDIFFRREEGNISPFNGGTIATSST